MHITFADGVRAMNGYRFKGMGLECDGMPAMVDHLREHTEDALTGLVEILGGILNFGIPVTDERPTYAIKARPEDKVGGLMYSSVYDDDADNYDVQAYVIIDPDEDGFLRLCSTTAGYVIWGTDDHKRTPGDAIRHAAEYDVECHERRLNIARKAMNLQRRPNGQE